MHNWYRIGKWNRSLSFVCAPHSRLILNQKPSAKMRKEMYILFVCNEEKGVNQYFDHSNAKIVHYPFQHMVSKKKKKMSQQSTNCRWNIFLNRQRNIKLQTNTTNNQHPIYAISNQQHFINLNEHSRTFSKYKTYNKVVIALIPFEWTLSSKRIHNFQWNSMKLWLLFFLCFLVHGGSSDLNAIK